VRKERGQYRGNIWDLPLSTNECRPNYYLAMAFAHLVDILNNRFDRNKYPST
jgi:hypothetical protein